MTFSPRPSRRTFVEGLALLLLPHRSFASLRGAEPVLRWKFSGEGPEAVESTTGGRDRIASRPNNAIWAGDGNDRSLRLDGYSVSLTHEAPSLRLSSCTLAAWVALEAYPVHDAAVFALGPQTSPLLRLGFNRLGFLEAAGAGPEGSRCSSPAPVVRGRWVHIALTLSETGEAVLYQDGVACNATPVLMPPLKTDAGVRITLARLDTSEVVARVFNTGVVNGLLREACVFDRCLAAREVSAWMQSTRALRPADLQLNRDWCAADPQRPLYHALPARAWTNEPHGVVFFGGEYHLFYQKNADGPYWGNINWGHMTSPDLYRWTEHAAALTPSPGPDSEGCWSGSVVAHREKLAILYTGGDGKRASLCLATTEDGRQFTKYANNPVIPAVPEGHNFTEFRDPFVWREGDTYYLIVGSAIRDAGGAALLYRSADLISWQYLRPLLTGDKQSSGVFWEMPVFIKVGDFHVLIVCEVPGRASYWVGRWKDEQFHPLSEAPQRLELFNHLLSPTPHHDATGRAIVMGIIPDERSPEETWKAGWAHLYSIPRVLSVGSDGRLEQAPLETIRGWQTPLHHASAIRLPAEQRMTLHPDAGTGNEIQLEIERGDAHAFSLFLRSTADARESTELRYDWTTETLTLDRTHSSLNPHVRRDSQSAPLARQADDRLQLDIFLDQSVLEVFVNGYAAFATRIYPTLPESVALHASASGGAATVGSLAIQRMPPLSARSA